MLPITADWLGNHVELHDIEATDLTLVQWRRPRHGAWRGAHVLDADELRHVRVVIARLDRWRRASAVTDDGTRAARGVRDGSAAPPHLEALHLEALFEDLLER